MGKPCQPWVSDENLARHLDFAPPPARAAQHDQLAAVDSFQHPDAQNDPTSLGPANLSTCKLRSSTLHDQLPDNRLKILINKPHSCAVVDRDRH
jgi:hypothetical protein